MPFNNLKNNTKDKEKQRLIDKGRPGSSCPKKFVALNKDFKETGMCTASREFQYLKIKELDSLGLDSYEYQKQLNKITEKSCTCVGLGTSALLAYDLDTKTEGEGVSICPGPNMAYYSKTMSLANITDHIYGRDNMVSRKDRPNLFVKELGIYMDYLKTKIEDAKNSFDKKEQKYLTTFAKNLKQGIFYYKDLFDNLKNTFVDIKLSVLNELDRSEQDLEAILITIETVPVEA